MKLILYKKPKIMFFEQHTPVYDVKKGWLQKIVKKKIIGESKNIYIEKIIFTICSDTKSKNYNKNIQVPIGFNKERLITQLKLFNL